VEKNGARVKLLGGNQGDSVDNETFFGEASVLGYRWPTTINQYLFGQQGPVIA